MYKKSEFTRPAYKTGEVAKYLNVTVRTVQQYDRDGKITVHRSEGGHRMILREDLLAFLDKNGLVYDDTQLQKRDVIYARVFSHEQKRHGDLDRQAMFLMENVPDLQNPLIMKEVGSGLSDSLKQLRQADPVRR